MRGPATFEIEHPTQAPPERRTPATTPFMVPWASSPCRVPVDRPPHNGYACPPDIHGTSELPRASRARVAFPACRRCPACGGGAAVSGGPLIVLGMLVGLFMEERMPRPGLILGGGIVRLGVSRLFKQ